METITQVTTESINSPANHFLHLEKTTVYYRVYISRIYWN